MQLHTQACLEYATSLQVATGKSIMGSNYVEHKSANLYQSLPVKSSSAFPNPFAVNLSKWEDSKQIFIFNKWHEVNKPIVGNQTALIL